MRRRSTFVHEPGFQFDPAELTVTKTTVTHPGLKAAREERLTYGFNELPEELQQVLNQAHELHVRWSPEHPHKLISPFVSRISPGLHVFYTPLEGHTDSLLCPLLRKTFSQQLKCQSPTSTFTTPAVLSERFASTASLQYHSPLPSLSNLVAYLQSSVCSRSNTVCLHDASLLNLSDSLDIDYDSISHTLTLTAFWSKPPAVLYDPISESTIQNSWKIDVRKASEAHHRVEVGVLSSSPATDAHDLQLSGFLTVVGEDNKPKPTLFHFPSRHHRLPETQSQQQYTAAIQQPGLHPTLQVSFPSGSALVWPENRPKNSQCALQVYSVLPSCIFADQYAFRSGDALFADSHNIEATHSISGELDLEAPDYVISRWGSTLLLEPKVPNANNTQHPSKTWNVTIPLHLRYVSPSPGGKPHMDLPWPIVYWACTAEEGTKFPVNPFDRVNLGFEGLYGPRTMFYHLEPIPGQASDGRMVESLTTPVYDSNIMSANTVEWLTTAVIVVGFSWIVVKLWPGLIRQFLDKEPIDGARAPNKQQQ